MKSITTELGEFAARTQFADLPAEVVDRAKACLLHNLGVALAGRRAEPLAHQLVARFYALPHEATLFWDGSKVSAEGAALANAALMHARTQDDTHFPSSTHTGSTVIPAALAMAEVQHSTGEEFLTAMVLGYEIAARIGTEYDTITTPRGFRATSSYGVFGAAAATAHLLKLNADETTAALGFAANLAGGLGQTWVEGSSEWRYHVGIAGRNGIFAARIAASGAVAASASLEGVAGFYAAFGGTVEFARAALVDLGKQWKVPEVTLKPYPVCAILQSPVAMMLDLVSTYDLKPAQVHEIVLELNPYEAAYPGSDSVGPFSDHGATLMSGQFCMALTLIERKATIEGLFRFDDPSLNELTQRVRIVSNDTFQPLSSRLTVTTVDGRKLSRETVATPTLHKFSFEEDAALVRRLLPEMETTAEGVERLIQVVSRVDRLQDVRELLTCMTGGEATARVATGAKS
ncbi:MAG: MmgE/PrpD family protein [Burkholderiaceae bacterium]|nr:MmgE/PrpD family protein [Burkholderiaceae bacterium]